MSFENNLSTRILEKDNFVAQVPCTFINPTNYLPLPATPVKGKYIGGTELCTSDNSCDAIRSKRIVKKAMSWRNLHRIIRKIRQRIRKVISLVLKKYNT